MTANPDITGVVERMERMAEKASAILADVRAGTHHADIRQAGVPTALLEAPALLLTHIRSQEAEIAGKDVELGELDQMMAEMRAAKDRAEALLRSRDEEIERLVEIGWRAVEFLEDEAEMRSAAGSSMSDYEREPRELAEALSQTLDEVEKGHDGP